MTDDPKTQKKFQTQSDLNAWLNICKKDYDDSKENGVEDSLQQSQKLWFWTAFSDLVKYSEMQGIECNWLRDAMLEVFSTKLEKLLPAVSKDHLMHLVEMLKFFGSSHDQSYQAVGQWTGYGQSSIENYHKKWRAQLLPELNQLPNQEDVRARFLKVCLFLINSDELIDKEFPSNWPKASSAFKRLCKKIESEKIGGFKIDVSLPVLKPIKKAARL